jgi:hypothetical protein
MELSRPQPPEAQQGSDTRIAADETAASSPQALARPRSRAPPFLATAVSCRLTGQSRLAHASRRMAASGRKWLLDAQARTTTRRCVGRWGPLLHLRVEGADSPRVASLTPAVKCTHCAPSPLCWPGGSHTVACALVRRGWGGVSGRARAGVPAQAAGTDSAVRGGEGEPGDLPGGGEPAGAGPAPVRRVAGRWDEMVLDALGTLTWEPRRVAA